MGRCYISEVFFFFRRLLSNPKKTPNDIDLQHSVSQNRLCPHHKRGRNAHVFSLCFSTPPTGATVPGTWKKNNQINHQFFFEWISLVKQRVKKMWPSIISFWGTMSLLMEMVVSNHFPCLNYLEDRHPIHDQPFHPDDHQVPGGQMFNVSVFQRSRLRHVGVAIVTTHHGRSSQN